MSLSKLDSAGGFRTMVRPAVQFVREIPVRSELALLRGRGPLAVFLPARGKEGSSLLRVYNIARALRGLGWRTFVLSWRLTLVQRRRFLDAASPDIVVMQGVRHELNRPSFYPEFPIVMDLDDADFHLAHLSEALRVAMPRVSAAIAGSAYVADWCRAAGAPRAHVVWTGLPVSLSSRPSHHTRPPVVAWAQTRPMTYRREADLVRSVMHRVSQQYPEVRLRLYDRQPGDGEDFADWFRSAGIRTEWYGAARFGDYIRMFDDVALGLAPLCTETPFSRGKSFGKILTYLDRHVPVICSAAGEHCAFFDDETGIMVQGAEDWVGAVGRLLDDPALRQCIATAGFSAFKNRLSLDAASRRVDRFLTAQVI